jgi:hypothetical protein
MLSVYEPWRHSWNGGIDSLILNLGDWLVSLSGRFTSWERPVGPHNRSRCFGKVNVLPLLEFEPRIVQPVL